MNEVIRQLMERKSVRAYTDREITAEQKRLILEAAMAAPTAGNQQLYTILDITDDALKQKLSVTCDNQPFIAQGKMVLIFCADFRKWFDVFIEGGCNPRKPGAGDLMLAVSDANIAAQNAVTAAQSLGIGSCYIGDIMENCETHRHLLGLPPYVFPAAMLVFGYPTEQQKQRPKPERCCPEDIVQENGYSVRNGKQLREMFEKECRSLSFEEWSSRFCDRKYNSAFSREMTRSVEVYLQSFGGEPLRDVLAEQDGRLEAFEKMLQNVKDRYADTVSKMDKLKADGKIKSVTYNQLMAEKLSLQKMLSMYGIYGLTKEEG